MTLKKLAPNHADIPLLNKLYIEAFPPSECFMSIEEFFDLSDKAPIDILGIYLDETPERFAGFFISFVKEEFVYWLFFAICAEMRSIGIGSKAIKAHREFYNGKTIVFDYESVFEESDNAEQRKRRRAFYLRNGFHETGWFFRVNNTEFIVTCSEEKLDTTIFEKLLQASLRVFSCKLEWYRRDGA